VASELLSWLGCAVEEKIQNFGKNSNFFSETKILSKTEILTKKHFCPDSKFDSKPVKHIYLQGHLGMTGP